jgi:PST family polysaccharide transporter
VGVDTIGAVVLNADYLLVGRYLGSEALGVYTLAFRIPELIILQFCAIVAQVVFPVFSKMKEDLPSLVHGYLKTSRYVALVTIPLGLGMFLLSDAFVRALFTDKWLEAIPVMQAISLYALFLSLGFNAGDVYKALGKPVVLTYISLVKSFVLIPGLLWAVTIPASTLSVAYVQLVVALLGTTLNLIVARRMLSISFTDLLRPYLPAIAAGALMSVAVLGVSALLEGWNPWLQLAIAPLAGGAIYAGALFLFQQSLVLEAFQLLRGVIARKS